MEDDPPLLDHYRITRAAEAMISNHGKNALAEADRRAQTLRSAGCVVAAANWGYVCEIIQVRIGGSTIANPVFPPDSDNGASPIGPALKCLTLPEWEELGIDTRGPY
jgi:hypothetical protein